MAALPPVAQVLRITLTHELGIDTTLGTRQFWQYTGGPPAPSDCNAIATAVSSAWGSDLAPMAISNVLLIGVEVVDLSSDTSSEGNWTGSIAGTRSGTQLPANVCAVINYDIARRYRGGKPRAYVPYGVEGDLTTAQQWGSTFTGALNSAWTNFKTAVQGITSGTTGLSNHCNVSYYSGFTNEAYGTPTKYRRVPTLRSTPVQDVITGHTIQHYVGSQRRRVRA